MSVRPSEDNAGRVSLNPVLTPGPKFTGVDQALEVVSRVDTHKLRRAMPLTSGGPGRFESKNTSSPSGRIVGRKSFCGVLSSAISAAGPNEPLAPSSLR
jgi:hypothetical protein